MVMRRVLLVGLSVLPTSLLGAVVVPAITQSASASCLPPMIVGSPIVLKHDRSQKVDGRFFQNGCADVIVCDGGDCQPTEEVTPRERVRLRLHQHGRSWVLDRADADETMQIRWTFELPRGVRAGKAWLRAPGAQRVTIRVR